ncbi:hypothetical protein [Algibacillus agarilyticus]|uniref:hypothetical protein n=1 Tax=Algibacillus agarilyticus TaxID=2234133 RepID=UPI000DCFC109|nr:hypothetical protein [Algibacillus agarilyticus]
MKVIKTLACVGLLATLSVQADTTKIGASLHQKFDLALNEIPAAAINAVKNKQAGITILEAEKELKHGHTYIDIEGKDADGNDIEFDLLQVGDKWKVVEIQRDLTLAQTPKAVVSELKKQDANIKPKRIIESVQNDGVIIYEFYTINSKGKEGKHEVKWHQEQASYLTKEWQH